METSDRGVVRIEVRAPCAGETSIRGRLVGNIGAKASDFGLQWTEDRMTEGFGPKLGALRNYG